MTRGVGGRKQLPVCHLCGREFGTASLKIHLKACAVKYEREKGKPAPPPPDMLNQLTAGDRPISQLDWDKYNEQANAAAEAEMEACPDCGRTFAAKDRLALHMRSCTGEKKILRAGEKSARSGASPPKAKPAAKPSLLRRISSGSLLGKGKEEGGGTAERKPSLLKRMSSGSLLRSSKPAEGQVRFGETGGGSSSSNSRSARGSGDDGGGSILDTDDYCQPATTPMQTPKPAADKQAATFTAPAAGDTTQGGGKSAKVSKQECSLCHRLSRPSHACHASRVASTSTKLFPSCSSLPIPPRPALSLSLSFPPFVGFVPSQDRIIELKELLDAGLVSQAEFDQHRAVIIQSV